MHWNRDLNSQVATLCNDWSSFRQSEPEGSDTDPGTPIRGTRAESGTTTGTTTPSSACCANRRDWPEVSS